MNGLVVDLPSAYMFAVSYKTNLFKLNSHELIQI